jgi:hypothetical protein
MEHRENCYRDNKVWPSIKREHRDRGRRDVSSHINSVGREVGVGIKKQTPNTKTEFTEIEFSETELVETYFGA